MKHAYVLPITILFSFNNVLSANDDLQSLKDALQDVKNLYEKKILTLEERIKTLEDQQLQVFENPKNGTILQSGKVINITDDAKSSAPENEVKNIGGRSIKSNNFNPSIGLLLNSSYNKFSLEESEPSGFAFGHEAERGASGFNMNHLELNLSSNVDDKLFASSTIALAQHEGEIELELEEAFIQSSADFGLPDGLQFKAGRAFWNVGYLNEHHSHTDDFVDRPLPNLFFLDSGFNADGIEFTYLMPTEQYIEIGGGLFNGNDFPFGGEGSVAYSFFAKHGGDIGTDHNYRIGAYYLGGEVKGERITNDEGLSFTGDSSLIVADIVYNFLPTGNEREKMLSVRGEYFMKNENGSYTDLVGELTDDEYDQASSGWYLQTVYKFNQNLRAGIRYSSLTSADLPLALVGSMLDNGDYNPRNYSVMVDWTNSEFSRFRLQLKEEQLNETEKDQQLLFQYIISIGAHGAHKY